MNLSHNLKYLVHKFSNRRSKGVDIMYEILDKIQINT